MHSAFGIMDASVVYFAMCIYVCALKYLYTVHLGSIRNYIIWKWNVSCPAFLGQLCGEWGLDYRQDNNETAPCAINILCRNHYEYNL
jgi:hypothetical protein